LIALWDGDDKRESGTANVIAWQWAGQSAPFAPKVGRLDELENGPVYHIATPLCKPDSTVDKVERKIYYPAGYGDHFRSTGSKINSCISRRAVPETSDFTGVLPGFQGISSGRRLRSAFCPGGSSRERGL
jgi:hypothetical protein